MKPDSDKSMVEQDSRYKQVLTDPRFKHLPKSKQKLKVDKRFKSLLKEKEFRITGGVDSRGRKKFTKEDSLKRFYDLDDSSSESLKSEHTNSSVEESDDETDIQVEYTQEEIDWINLDKDAQISDDTSSRLALCNMDWDRITASDLYLAVYSLLPGLTGIKSVKIYHSEFGKRCLEKEAVLGPKLQSVSDDEDSVEELRRYQLERLKYCYAVIELDSVETAVHVYKEAESLEFESSGNRFDLRFIPDSVTFEENDLKEMCDRPPDPTEYKPNFYRTTAIAQTKVDCTWDETPRDRLALIQAACRPDLSCDDLNRLAPLVVNDDDDFEHKSASDPGETDELRLDDFRKKLVEHTKPVRSESEESEIMEISWNDGEDDMATLSKPIIDEPMKKSVVKKNKKNKSLLKEMKRAKKQNDDFAINLDDPRFKAVFTEPHLFNIDPNDRLYKETPEIKQLITKVVEHRSQRLK